MKVYKKDGSKVVKSAHTNTADLNYDEHETLFVVYIKKGF